MIIVRCTEYRGCPLLGGSLSINDMLNSIRVIDFVRCTEVVRFSECPLWEVPLYIVTYCESSWNSLYKKVCEGLKTILLNIENLHLPL